MFAPTGRFRSTTLVVAIASAVAAAALVPTAHAATYELEQCTSARPATAGWATTHSGSWVAHGDECASGAGLRAWFDPGIGHNNGDHIMWRFTAPSNTTIHSMTVENRSFQAGRPNPDGWGDSAAMALSGSGDLIEQCVQLYGCGIASGPALWVPVAGSTQLLFGVRCVGVHGCPADTVQASARGIRVRLQDDTPPSVTGVSGSLTSASTTQRVRQLSFSASDSGGGVFRRRLVVDDAVQSPATVDVNGGACAQPFTTRVPCKLSAGETFSFDTAALADGRHDVSLRVTDATDDNTTQTASWPILVDNQPPSIGAPVLSGTPREGDTLTCAAAAAGQTPQVGFRWLRANPDGSGATEIAGATNAAYAVGAADIARKLICRVTATDAGGTAVRDSTITQSPFDKGRSVAPYCSERPTGSRDECGDLDGDGNPNRTDPDADGDGILNPDDSSPYDASKPGAGGGSSTSVTSGSQTTQSHSNTSTTTVVAAAGPGSVRFSLGRASATFVGRQARWANSAFVLRGRLTTAAGAPIAGARVVVTQTVGSRTVKLGESLSRTDGSWAHRVPRGPSRTLTVSAASGPDSATMTVRQRVTAHVTFRATSRKVRRGGRVLFRGTLRGGHTNTREKLVEFQVHFRGAWRTISTLHTDRKGRFSVRYRFGAAAYGRYTFRARTLPTDGYPFGVGVSRGRGATVRVG